jgi:hypothetical protein
MVSLLWLWHSWPDVMILLTWPWWIRGWRMDLWLWYSWQRWWEPIYHSTLPGDHWIPVIISHLVIQYCWPQLASKPACQPTTCWAKVKDQFNFHVLFATAHFLLQSIYYKSEYFPLMRADFNVTLYNAKSCYLLYRFRLGFTTLNVDLGGWNIINWLWPRTWNILTLLHWMQQTQ